MLQHPATLLDSNCCVMAVDDRFVIDFVQNDAIFNKSDSWIRKHVDLKNDKAWCDFLNIQSLANAPKANNYRDLEGVSISNFIDIFREAALGESVDYVGLKNRLNGVIAIPNPVQVAMPPEVLHALRRTAERSLRRGRSVEEVAEDTELPIEEVQAIYDGMNR
ncbi:MAG: hypothetical protein LBP36_00125 [Oscillospiraceae bacterium]|nr:hypothetical protein [Oscillospiraceae bacterium]